MKRGYKHISLIREFLLLIRQGVMEIVGSPKPIIIGMLFPVMGILCMVFVAGENMFVHYDGTKSGNFLLVSAAIWGGLFNSVQAVVRERANIKRDFISGGLRVSCYVASRASIQMILCAVQSLILVSSYYLIERKYDAVLPEEGIVFSNLIVELFISVFLLMYASDALGIMISCIVRKQDIANAAAPYILIVQLIFSGVLFGLEGMTEKISYFMLSRWGMEAIGSSCALNDLPLKIQLSMPTAVHKAEDMFEGTREHLFESWEIMAAFTLLYLIIGTVALRSVKKDSRD